MKPIKLYSHKTDGGAEYLFDTFIKWENDGKKGKEGRINDKTNVVIRLDGQPELTYFNRPIKAVMVEYIDENNQWAWYEVSKNETPKQAIKRYLDNDELCAEIIKVKGYDVPGCASGEYWIAKTEDVRAFYITI